MYSDVLPTTEVDVMQGLVSRMHCVLLCARQSSCQTIFYKSSESKCFLYKYPMLERTPVNPEMGTDVYEMQGCSNPVFALFREKDVCLKTFSTTNRTFSYASTACEQEAGALTMLNTTETVDALAHYLYYTFGADAMKAVTIGLRNLSSWQWTNGKPFSIVHPHLTASLNSYDRNMDPCAFNFCGIFTTVSLTDLRIFDNCCHNVMSSFACFTKALT
ncbi:uncharacterized protein LOC144625431 [Crassostrea virginica]